jgi:uncharacterized protein (TIGR02118 family)
MIRVTITYPNQSGARFDFDYYVSRHMQIVRERLAGYGLKRASASKGLAGMAPGSPADLLVQAFLDFDTIEHVQAGMAAESPALLADLANFTDVQPNVQINEVLV